MTIADVRNVWPAVLDKIRELRRFAWVMLSQNAQVMALNGTTLTIALVNPGARDSFISSRSDEYVQQALHSVLGVTWKIDAIVDPSARPAASSPSPEPESAPVAPRPRRRFVGGCTRGTQRDRVRRGQQPRCLCRPRRPGRRTEEIDPELLLSRELGAEVIGETSAD